MNTVSIDVTTTEHMACMQDINLGILICKRLTEKGVPVFGSGILPKIIGGTVTVSIAPDLSVSAVAVWGV